MQCLVMVKHLKMQKKKKNRLAFANCSRMWSFIGTCQLDAFHLSLILQDRSNHAHEILLTIRYPSTYGINYVLANLATK